ncbi:MAG: hypothetical protein IJV45_10735 [Prevotella sp.]|nr:hypothetical protein [Prevotella sp.]MBR1448894.1 hypothetical protein [Prevotella sp.]MBR1450001.1 hypothetical protein [Prevotella sp.]
MKRKMNYWLMVALIGGLSMSVASCKDDDKELSEEEKQQQAEQQAEQDMADAATFWDVVGQLTDDVMPDDWQNATYEPSIGEADATNAAVRVVSTADVETAAERFAQLTGAAVNASTTEYTYQTPLVGSLTYRRTGGQSLATVDISIKQMPGLSQIIYKSPEQMGENGSFKGTAYYRFGDVVQKLNADGQYDYWICVRPAFGPESKGDSHWITLSKLPSANVKTVNKTVNGQKLSHTMPKSLGTNKEHMQNLAELVYAITASNTWAANLAADWKTLKYFKDFHYDKTFKYHNASFFSNVNEGMPDRVFQEIFGLTKQQMRQELEQYGLHLVYNSPSMSGNNIILPVAEYAGTNLKTARYYNSSSTWDAASFDVYALSRNHYISDARITGGNGKMWICRYATGATLAKGSAETPASFDKYKRLPNCRDVFVYNADVDNLDLDNLKNIEPREGIGDFSGIPYYQYGEILQDQNGHRWFVINQAGNPDNGIDVGEKSPYSELISFEGITVSNDRRKATNLPTLKQAIRGAYFLEMFYNSTTDRSHLTKEQWMTRGTYAKFGVSWANVLEYCDVEMRDLFQKIFAQSGDPRQATLAASIAYDDGSGKQRLLRWIRNNQVEGQNMYYYLSDLYPASPNATTQFYEQYAYSTLPIYLQDIASKQMVESFAEDTYVRQPLVPNDNLMNNGDSSPRQPRTETDDRVLDVRNCLYYRTAWEYRSFVSDMWKAPILMFRMTRVYDHGENEYSDTTVDGLRLTKIARHDWSDTDGTAAEENLDEFRNQTMNIIWANCYKSGVPVKCWFLNGEPLNFPTWRTAW